MYNTADAGLHYGMAASLEIEASLKRLRSIIERIPTTKSTKEALDLNSYARAEAVRIGLMVERVKASAERVDEPVWELPLAKRYRKELLSPIADLRNMGSINAGTITAAVSAPLPVPAIAMTSSLQRTKPASAAMAAISTAPFTPCPNLRRV